MLLAHSLTVLALLALTVTVDAQQKQRTTCTLGRVPVEPTLTGKAISASHDCSNGGGFYQNIVQFYNWGISYTPYFFIEEFERGCRADIVVAYTRSNRVQVIYYRPSVKPHFFKHIAPATFKHYQNLKRHVTPPPNTKWPCHKVPVQRVHVWRQRKLFVKLVKLAVKEMTYRRNLDCEDPRYYGRPDAKFSWDRVREKIKRDRIYTAAITFFHGVAYSNYFCV